MRGKGGRGKEIGGGKRLIFTFLYLNPLKTDDKCTHHDCMLSVGVIRFEDRFCTSRKSETGGGGWVSPSG